MSTSEAVDLSVFESSIEEDMIQKKELAERKAFNLCMMFTKMSIGMAPGLGNLVVAGYIYYSALPRVRYSRSLTSKYRTIAKLNLLFTFVATWIVLCIAYN